MQKFEKTIALHIFKLGLFRSAQSNTLSVALHFRRVRDWDEFFISNKIWLLIIDKIINQSLICDRCFHGIFRVYDHCLQQWRRALWTAYQVTARQTQSASITILWSRTKDSEGEAISKPCRLKATVSLH